MSAVEPDKEGPKRIRAAVIGHSLIHFRQYNFFNHIQYSPWLYNFTEILQLYPEHWGAQIREGGQSASGTSIIDWRFDSTETFANLISFKPNVVYVQQEFYCDVTRQIHDVVRQALPKAAFVVFIWENLQRNASSYSDPKIRELIEDTDFVICGTTEAKNLVRPFIRANGNSSGEVEEAINEKLDIFPQVGVDVDDYFYIKKDMKKEYDFIFVGRAAEDKGWKVIERAIDQHINILYRSVDKPYQEMPIYYNKSRVHLSPVLDRPYWREQHASYANLEALSCGNYVVTSDSSGIVEYLKGVPGVYFVHQDDVADLSQKAQLALEEYKQNGVNREGRKWVMKNLSMQAIGLKTINAWKKAIEIRQSNLELQSKEKTSLAV